jgi:hypothetical protein
MEKYFQLFFSFSTQFHLKSKFEFEISLFSLFNKLHLEVEATWAIANALSNGTDEHVRYLVHQGCIEPMAEVMVDADMSTLEAILEGFDHILRGILCVIFLIFLLITII